MRGESGNENWFYLPQAKVVKVSKTMIMMEIDVWINWHGIK